MSEPPPPNRLRRSARVILLDDESRVLLIRFVLPRGDGDYHFWVTPGGEIGAGEYPLAAAQRELREKLGLVLPLSGPVPHASGTFELQHEIVDNADAFYLARFAGGRITLDGIDAEKRAGLKEVRWWRADDIDASVDPIYPFDLADAVRRLTGSNPRA